jgi:ABC-type multidrug transport system ATPase subunit
MGADMISVNEAVTAIAGNPVHAPVTFQLNSGELGVITGGNGSGKTSLLHAILGELRIIAGSISICGQNVKFGHTYRLTRSLVRIIPQFPISPESMTVAEYIKVWHRYRPTGTSNVDVGEVVRETEEISGHSADVLIDTLSHGQKRLLDIILASAANPRLLLADEPLAGLSPIMITWTVDRLNGFRLRGGALLVVAHKPERQFWDANWLREVIPV